MRKLYRTFNAQVRRLLPFCAKTAVAGVCFMMWHNASAQDWIQRGEDLFPKRDSSGVNVDLSYDGTRIATGFSNKYSFGFTVVQEWNGQSWQVLGDTIFASSTGIALNDGGTILAVGDHENNKVDVFEWNNNAWVQMGEKLIPSGGSVYGVSMDLDSAGTRIAIGQHGVQNTDGTEGRVDIYDWDGNAWSQKGETLVGYGKQYNDLWSQVYTDHISLSSDGNVVAFASYEQDINDPNSVVRIFQWDGSLWETKGSIPQRRANSVALNRDGNMLAVGEPFEDNPHIPEIVRNYEAGRVTVHQWNNEIWQVMGDTLYGADEFDYLGTDVSLSDDGGILAVGTPDIYSYPKEHSYVLALKWNGSSWEQHGDTIHEYTEAGRFGYAVDVSEDGKVIAGGATGTGSNADQSMVQVFEISEITALNEFGNQSDVGLYPNPTTGTVYVPEVSKNASITVRNAMGVKVNGNLQQQGTTTVVNIDGPSGIYFVEIADGQQDQQVLRVMKE